MFDGKESGAKNIFAAAQLYIPSDHDVLRDYDALTSNTEDELHGKEAAKVDTLREFLARRNRVWIVDCVLNGSQHSVSINYRYTEEFDDARFAHQNGVVERNFLQELVEGKERRACCSNGFGGLSVHGMLKRLVVLCGKATRREEGRCGQSELRGEISKRAKGQLVSPFIDMFENSQPRNGRDSLLEVAISGLKAFDRQQQKALKDPEPMAQYQEVQGLKLDETLPDFDIHFQEFLDLNIRIKAKDARTRKGSFLKRKLSRAATISTGKRLKFFNRHSRTVTVPITTTNEKASPTSVDVERSLSLPVLDKIANSQEKKVQLAISFSRSSRDPRANPQFTSPFNVLRRIFPDEALFDEAEEVEESSPITAANTSPCSNSFALSNSKSNNSDESDWKPPSPAQNAVTAIQWAPNLPIPSSSSSSSVSQMVTKDELMIQNRASHRLASIIAGVTTCCSKNVKDKQPEVDELEGHKEPEVDKMEGEDGKIAEAVEVKAQRPNDYECTLDNLCPECRVAFRFCGELPGKKSAIVEKAVGWFVWPSGPRCILHQKRWMEIEEEEFEEVDEAKGLPGA